MKYLPLLLLLISSTAMACGSYEECMDEYNKLSGGPDIHVYFLQKAIAFKLDEISKKLDE